MTEKTEGECVECPECGGVGGFRTAGCPRCEGTGRVESPDAETPTCKECGSPIPDGFTGHCEPTPDPEAETLTPSAKLSDLLDEFTRIAVQHDEGIENARRAIEDHVAGLEQERDGLKHTLECTAQSISDDKLGMHARDFRRESNK